VSNSINPSVGKEKIMSNFGDITLVVLYVVGVLLADLACFGLLFGLLRMSAILSVRFSHVIAFILFVVYLMLWSPYAPVLNDWRYLVIAVSSLISIFTLAIRPSPIRKAS
jgi:hypothetical protein